jgi:hypothetical protein
MKNENKTCQDCYWRGVGYGEDDTCGQFDSDRFGRAITEEDTCKVYESKATHYAKLRGEA